MKIKDVITGEKPTDQNDSHTESKADNRRHTSMKEIERITCHTNDSSRPTQKCVKEVGIDFDHSIQQVDYRNKEKNTQVSTQFFQMPKALFSG